MHSRKPLCIELFAGRFGWGKGAVAAGFRVVGFDILHESYHKPIPEGCELVLQDVLTLHGSQFRDADLILASPPCTEYSYMAMPWSRAKQIAAALRGEGEFPKGYSGSRTLEQLNRLFNACFRIQLEASQAAGRHIPMVIENVKGAQPWVGVAACHYGAQYLWGDVPALLPFSGESEGIKQHGSGALWFDRGIASYGSQSHARKTASAMIAEIPFSLAEWIARYYLPGCSQGYNSGHA